MAMKELEPEWIRLPKPKTRCPLTGLSRTSLVELLDEIDPATGEPFVRQMRKERHGKQRRIRLIHKQSLLDYLDQRARAQALQFAEHVNNPKGYSVDDVLSDRLTFNYFIGDDNHISAEDWDDGKLSTRRKRVKALRDLELLK